MGIKLRKLQREKKFQCPFCLEKVSFVIDLSEDGEHRYTEDCEVCCNPIDVKLEVLDHQLVEFEIERSHSA